MTDQSSGHCEVCGSAWPDDSAFCGSCGATVAARVALTGVMPIPQLVDDEPDPEMTIARSSLPPKAPMATVPAPTQVVPTPVEPTAAQPLVAPSPAELAAMPPPLPATAPMGGGPPPVPALAPQPAGPPAVVPQAPVVRPALPLTGVPPVASVQGSSNDSAKQMLIWGAVAGGLILLMLIFARAAGLLAILACAVIGVVVLFVFNERRDAARKAARRAEIARGFPLRMDQEQAASVLAQQLAASGATINTHSSSLINGTVMVKGSANILIAILLWFICIVPMIIYVVSASKDTSEPFSIRIDREGDGVRVYPSGQGMAVDRIVKAIESIYVQVPGSR